MPGSFGLVGCARSLLEFQALQRAQGGPQAGVFSGVGPLLAVDVLELEGQIAKLVKAFVQLVS